MAVAEDTIYALSTPPGRGGVAVIRISGAGALSCLTSITGHKAPAPRHVVFCKISDPVSRETIDHGLALFFKEPASYTGEDVVEFHVHGGTAIISRVLDILSRSEGFRLAEPGEFTRRAFEHGKMDLTESEAVADLIAAETELQRRQALGQLEGGLKALYGGWAESLKKALAHLEADIEFPDEDMPEGLPGSVAAAVAAAEAAIAAHLTDNRRGERLRQGVRIAVIGAPNAGKSSLVNALARREVSIISPFAGTTRDVVEAHLDLGGYPVILSDTAGLRPEQLGDSPHDIIENEGIKRALAVAEQADIRLLLLDASALPALDVNTLALRDERAIVAFNKCDIHAGALPLPGACRLSAATGQGLEDLVNLLISNIKDRIGSADSPALTRHRHRAALTECRDSLVRARQAALPELAAEDIRLAVRALGRITGRVDVEDLLDVIFRDFCIGK